MFSESTLFSPKVDKSYKSCDVDCQQMQNCPIPELVLEKNEFSHSDQEKSPTHDAELHRSRSDGSEPIPLHGPVRNVNELKTCIINFSISDKDLQNQSSTES